MENIPPSYEAAIDRNPWRLITPYIISTDLCALNRVNHELHEVFAPCLWGNPASHFGTENDRVYVALTRFKRTLKRVRLSVRELTHTLHLPPAQPELYDGPHPEWLHDVFEQLPNLQSLVVSGLPFFDHMALLALRRSRNDHRPHLDSIGPSFPLRLLIAEYCQNTTSAGLVEGLTHFPGLAFLDLSNTLAARDKGVLAKLSDLPLLQVLKLRNVNLRDEDVNVLVDSIGLRVRSLDLEGNHLTDHSVRALLGSCFEAVNHRNGVLNHSSDASSNLAVGDWPSGFVRPDPTALDEFIDESYDQCLVRRLTSGAVSRLPYEDMPHSGITHLYISNNYLTVEGLSALIKSGKLHVLDAGSIYNGTVVSRPGSLPPVISVRTPGVEKLTPVLARHGQEITSMRFQHTIVTKDAPSEEQRYSSLKSELSGESLSQEVNGGQGPAELDAAPPLYELENLGFGPRCELPGDSIHFLLSPPIGEKPTLTNEESQPEARRGSIYAPEVLDQEEQIDEEFPVLTATGLGTKAQTMNGISRNMLSKTDIPEAVFGRSQNTREMRLALIEKQRREFRENQLAKPHGLTPGMLPKLRFITLVDVPAHTRCQYVIDALIRFLTDCASEAELAKIQATLEPNSLREVGRVPPQRARYNAREIFALKMVILEMAPHRSKILPNIPQTVRTKSSTEDPDSEALWSAAENDFTFFDDDEECGQPSINTDNLVTSSVLSEKIMMPTGENESSTLPLLPHSTDKEPLIDVVQELTKFRKERKAAYEDATRRGLKHVDGYWPGEVKVVRGHHASGHTHSYNNHFGMMGVNR